MSKPPLRLRKLIAEGRRAVMASLTGYLVYFRDLSQSEEYSEYDEDLSGKLLLIQEDTLEHKNREHSILGYIINQPSPKAIRDHFMEAARPTTHHYHFKPILDSSNTGFSFEHNFSFILPRDKAPVMMPNKFLFNGYAAFICESSEDTAITADLLKDRRDFIVVFSHVEIERERLVPMIEDGYALARKADPETVLTGSVLTRTIDTFPEIRKELVP